MSISDQMHQTRPMKLDEWN